VRESRSRSSGPLASIPARLLPGIFIVLVPVVLIQLLITSLSLPKLGHSVLIGLVTPPVALGAYFAFVRFVEHRHAIELDIAHAARELVMGAVLGAGLFGAVMASLAVLGSLVIAGTNQWNVMLVPFIAAVSSGVFEEILFRGLLYRILEDGLGSWLALVSSGLIFGGLHLLNPNSTWMGAVAVFLTAGILLGACFALTRRLWLPMGLHFAWNFTQSGIFGLAVSGSNALPGILKSSLLGSAWLTGGEFGPEASVITVILGLALGAVIVRRAMHEGRLARAPWAQKSVQS
jgi:membrane protease YdiL (CAAX protease family)